MSELETELAAIRLSMETMRKIGRQLAAGSDMDIQTAKETHPLLNSDSKHYRMVDGVEAIERLELMFTAEELAVWAKITVMKYRLRIGNKDDAVKEVKKIQTYEAYYKYLQEKTDGEL